MTRKKIGAGTFHLGQRHHKRPVGLLVVIPHVCQTLNTNKAEALLSIQVTCNLLGIPAHEVHHSIETSLRGRDDSPFLMSR